MLLGFLKAQAREKGLTDQDIADRTGFFKTNVIRMFGGKFMPSLDNFLLLGEAIGVNLQLHTGTDVATVTTRNSKTPRFMFAPDQENKELYILHAHYPACLIKVVQTIPATFQIVENYDLSDDYNEVLADGQKFFHEQYKNDSKN